MVIKAKKWKLEQSWWVIYYAEFLRKRLWEVSEIGAIAHYKKDFLSLMI